MTDSKAFRACTFNVRYDAVGDDHRWDDRKSRVVETVRSLDPDVLGVQEALAHQFDDLRTALRGDGYEWHGVGRRDGDRAGEFVPVAWRADRFEALETGAFWLSETPEEPSVGWDADLPRVSTWVTLRDRTAEERLWFCNTHFDHAGERARLESARLLRCRAAERIEGGATAVVTGDLNAPPESPPYDALTGGALADARSAATDVRGPAGTFHGFTGDFGDRIDYVLVGPAGAVERYRALEPNDGAYRSDHVPVVATGRFEL